MLSANGKGINKQLNPKGSVHRSHQDLSSIEIVGKVEFSQNEASERGTEEKERGQKTATKE